MGWADFFPLAQLFAANAVSGPILAMYMVSLDSKPSSYDHIMAFESEQRILNAAERACGAMKFLLPSAATCRGDRKMPLEMSSAHTSFNCRKGSCVEIGE